MHRLWLPFLCLAVAALIALAAIADHRWKQHRINRAEVDEWYCIHTGMRCGGASSAAIERHWNERQLGYEVAVSVLGAAGLALGVYRAIRR